MSTVDQQQVENIVEFNLSNFVKFPTMKIESMQTLQNIYLRKSIQQLQLLGIEKVWHMEQESIFARVWASSGQAKVNRQTNTLRLTLLHLIEELANFNQQNLEILKSRT